jgi:hypothetical protein
MILTTHVEKFHRQLTNKMIKKRVIFISKYEINPREKEVEILENNLFLHFSVAAVL